MTCILSCYAVFIHCVNTVPFFYFMLMKYVVSSMQCGIILISVWTPVLIYIKKYFGDNLLVAIKLKANITHIRSLGLGVK